MITKSELIDAYQRAQQANIDTKEETATQLEQWVRTLRSVSETLDNTLATDFQMEMVRQAVNGLIIQQVEYYKEISKTLPNRYDKLNNIS